MEKRQTRSQTAKNPDASFQSLDTSTRKSLRKRFNLNSSSINETLTPPLSVLESGDSDLEISRNLNFEKFSQKEVVNIEKESDFEYFEKEKRKTFDILSPGADFNVKKYNLDHDSISRESQLILNNINEGNCVLVKKDGIFFNIVLVDI